MSLEAHPLEHLVHSCGACCTGRWWTISKWNLGWRSESLEQAMGLQPNSTSCSLPASWVWLRCDDLTSCSCHHTSPAHDHLFPTVMCYIALEVQVKINPFSLSVAFVGLLYGSNRKRNKDTSSNGTYHQTLVACLCSLEGERWAASSTTCPYCLNSDSKECFNDWNLWSHRRIHTLPLWSSFFGYFVIAIKNWLTWDLSWETSTAPSSVPMLHSLHTSLSKAKMINKMSLERCYNYWHRGSM